MNKTCFVCLRKESTESRSVCDDCSEIYEGGDLPAPPKLEKKASSKTPKLGKRTMSQRENAEEISEPVRSATKI